MSGQRARSAVPAEHRSVHPDFPGVPWWGAVLVALTATAVGFAFDAGSGNKELSWVFAVSYIVGCLLAVSAVRQAGLFTAVIQPPIVLFVAVPGSYFLLHRGQIHGLKDLAINCGYPLIERFPLMFFTSAVVLLIGMGRWYYGMSTRQAAPQGAEQPASPVAELLATLTTKLTTLVTALRVIGQRVIGRRDGGAEPEDATAPPRKRSADRSSRATRGAKTARRSATKPRAASRAEAAARTADGSRPSRRRSAADASAEPRSPTRRRAAKGTKVKGTKVKGTGGARATPPRSRRSRPLDTDYIEPVSERPRRARPHRQDEPPIPPMPPAEPRRRSRSQAPRERGQPPTRRRRLPPREPRRQPPVDRSGPIDRSGWEPYDPPPRPRRFNDYEPLEPHGRTGGRNTHHPVSRVRYRSDPEGDEYRSRPRHARYPDSWEYDI